MNAPETPDDEERDALLMRLFVTHERAVLRFILGFVPALNDARDILQETAVTLWAKRTEFDPAREYLPWACGIARFKVREFWKKQPRWESFAQEDLLDLMEAQREAMRPELSEREARLRECVQKLPEDSRQVLVRYYVEGESIEEVARQQTRTVEAIYKLLQRVRRALLDCVQRLETAR